MDYRVVSGVLAVLCSVLVVYVFSGVGVERVTLNGTVYPQDNLRVSYLYPLRCVNCDLNVPGQCDYCTSYYDDRVMDMLSQDVGAPMNYYVSDAVNKPTVLIQHNRVAVLADGRSKLNIANALCRVAGVNRSCDLYRGELGRVVGCVGRYGVGASTVIYHFASKGCPLCLKTSQVVGDLKAADYNETAGYDVYSVDRSDPDGFRMVSECLQGFEDSDTVPQLLCPKTGQALTGEFSLSQALRFADKCIEAHDV